MISLGDALLDLLTPLPGKRALHAEYMLQKAVLYNQKELAEICILAGAHVYTRMQEGEYQGFLPSVVANQLGYSKLASFLTNTASAATHCPDDIPFHYYSDPGDAMHPVARRSYVYEALKAYVNEFTEFLFVTPEGEKKVYAQRIRKTLDAVLDHIAQWDDLTIGEQRASLNDFILQTSAHLSKNNGLLAHIILHHAIKTRQYYLSELCLADVANVNAAPNNEGTALHIAAAAGDNRIVQKCIAREADINSQDCANHDTPLIIAARNGHINTVHLLLENGAHLESFNDANETALSVALKNGHTAIVNVMNRMISARDDAVIAWESTMPDERDKRLEHELCLLVSSKVDHALTQFIFVQAAGAGNVHLMQHCLKYGAQLDAPDHTERSALTRAYECKQYSVMRCLLSAGAHPDSLINHEDDTLLMLAASQHDRLATTMLLQYKADHQKRNKHGHTAYDIAVSCEHLELARQLAHHGIATELGTAHEDFSRRRLSFTSIASSSSTASEESKTTEANKAPLVFTMK